MKLDLSRQVAKDGERFIENDLEARSLLDDLIEMVWHLDEPYGGGLPAWYVFSRV